MQEDANIKLKTLKVDGGASANNFLMQFQSDIINVPVRRPQTIETTAMGASYLAGLAVGVYKDINDIINNCNIDKEFTSKITEEERQNLLKGWRKAVKHAFEWAKD